MVYEKRLEYLTSIMPLYGKDSISSSASSPSSSAPTNKIPPYARIVPVKKCQSKAHLMRELDHVQSNGGEGIMLRTPRSRYEFKRSRTLLKVKTFFDEEAIVMAQVKGTGKHSHRMGHLEVKTPDGRCFSVGSGFTDAQRERPPKVGSVITYKFQELSNKLNPRFPTFVGERIDIKWSDYCKTYKAPTLKAATPAKVVPLLKQNSLIFQDKDDDDDDDDANGDSSTTTAFLNGDNDGDDNSNGADEGAGSDAGSDYTPDSDTPTTTPAADSPGGRSNSSSSPSSATNRKRAHDQTLDTSTGNNSSDDNDNNGTASSGSSSKQEPCRYGANCYRKNPDHLKRFSHPPKRFKA